MNVDKHGIDFSLIEQIDWQTAISIDDDRQDYGEDRIIAFGKIGGRLHVCLYTPRGETRRIISLHKANQREEKFYAEETAALD